MAQRKFVRKRKSLLDEFREEIKEMRSQNLTLEEISAALKKEHNLDIHITTIGRFCEKEGLYSDRYKENQESTESKNQNEKGDGNIEPKPTPMKKVSELTEDDIFDDAVQKASEKHAGNPFDGEL